MTDTGAKVHGTRRNSTKTLTELKTKRSTLKGTITRIMNQIDMLIRKDNVDGVNEVSSKYDQLKTTVSVFKDVHLKYHSALKDECDIDESLEYYSSVQTKVTNCLAKVSEWIDRQKSVVEATIAEQMSELSDGIKPEDSASNVSTQKSKSKSPKKSTVSKKSSCVKSTTSNTSSTSKLRLQASAKRAALEAESMTLQRRQSLEMKECLLDMEFQRKQLDQEKAKFALQQERERLAFETELCKVYAEEKIYSNAESHDVNLRPNLPKPQRDNGMIGMHDADKESEHAQATSLQMGMKGKRPFSSFPVILVHRSTQMRLHGNRHLKNHRKNKKKNLTTSLLCLFSA